MAGTVTITEENLSNIKKITFAWTSSAGGAADGATTLPYSGLVAYAVTVPGAGGNAPTDNYDITLVDGDGLDVALGVLANRDTANTEWITSGMAVIVGDVLTLHVTNAGDTKSGTLIVYITPAGQSLETSIAALYGADGIVAFPAAAAAADGVSIAEVLRYIQESQIGTLANTGGTATLGGILGDVSNASVATSLAKLGTLVNTGGTPTLGGMLGDLANVTIAAWLQKIGTLTNSGGTATLGGIIGDVANSSIATRLAAIQAATSGGVGGYDLARRSYNFGTDGGAQGTLTMFAVTGTVIVQVFGVCQTDLSGVLATIELGIPGNTAALVAQTLATDLDQYETWQDATPEANPGAIDLTSRSFVITNGADIGLKIATADLTGGVIDFYCLWSPLSAGAMVVAA